MGGASPGFPGEANSCLQTPLCSPSHSLFHTTAQLSATKLRFFGPDLRESRRNGHEISKNMSVYCAVEKIELK